MGVIYTISIIFLETLTAYVAFVAFCFLLKEHWHRRQRHLLFFALSFLSAAAGYVMLFVGQIMSAYQAGGVANRLVEGVNYTVALQALWILFGLLEIYGPKAKSGLLSMLALGIPTASFLATLFLPVNIVVIAGIAVPYLTLSNFLLIFGALILAGVSLVVAGTRLHAEPGRHWKPDAFFSKAGITLLIVLSMMIFAIIFETAIVFPLSVAIQLIFFVLLFFAAVAKNDPDPVIAEKPTTFFTRRLFLKATILTVALFWLLAYLLLAITSTYFVAASLGVRKTGLRRDVHFFSKSFASSVVLFLEETGRLADIPSLPDMIGKDAQDASQAIKSFLSVDGKRRIVRIIGSDGKVVFSSYSDEEVGLMLDSAVMRKALAGKRVAATEHDAAMGAWALRAAVPMDLGDGSSGGAMLTTDLSYALDFSEYLAISPVLANGYGYVTESGVIAYSSGEPVDEVTKTSYRRLLGSGAAFNGTSSDDDVFLEHTFATDGSPNGFFYIRLSQSLVDSESFRILSIVMVVVLLAVLFMTAILLFSISTVLRPIKELRDAANRVEGDDYDVRVRYGSADELGELARAFNRMSAAIADRTVSLEQALGEQRDFLNHSVRFMRSPLSVFRWTLELMRFGDTGRLNKEQLELLEQMHQTNERLTRVLQDLQTVLWIEQGKYSVKSEIFPLEDVVDEVAGEVTVPIREKNIFLHWNRPHQPLPHVIADRTALKKVLSHLLTNAVKFNRANGHIEIILAKSDGPPGSGPLLKVAIEDSGNGIPKAEQNRVFTRFFRSKEVLAEEIDGAGLGLYIAKRLVELQGGSIWFESKEGKGTTFYFTVPFDPKTQANDGI